MGAAIDSGDNKKNVDVYLNIVPFIDLLSCLTAFLLVTAVWSSMAQISIKPKGIGRTPPDKPIEDVEEKIVASILVQENSIWVCLSRINDIRQIAKTGPDYNWQELLDVLTEHKKSSYFADRQDIEVAAEDKITYQGIISTMDTAVAAGFADVGLADPGSLTCKPQL